MQILDKKTQKEQNKLDYLDGLRGIGSLAVVNSHVFTQFYANFYGYNQDSKEFGYYQAKDEFYPFLWYLEKTPLCTFYNGQYWVYVFFVLSGFVLSLSYMKQKKIDSIKAGIFKRYFRLMLPILIIFLTRHVFFKFNNIQQPIPTLLQTFFDSSLLIFYGSNKQEGVLWTIQIEFWGSFIVYNLVLLSKNIRAKNFLFFLTILFLVFSKPDIKQNILEKQFYVHFRFYEGYISFVLGCWLCSMEVDENSILNKIKRLPCLLSIIKDFSLLGIFFYGSMFKVSIFFKDGDQYESYIRHISVCSIMILSLTSKYAQSFLNLKIIQFLAKISFMLYLFHETIKNTLVVYLIPFYEPYFSKSHSIFLSYFTNLPIIFIASLLLENYVDAPSRNFAHNLYVSLKKNDSYSETSIKDDKLLKFLSKDLFFRNLILLLIFLSFVNYRIIQKENIQ